MKYLTHINVIFLMLLIASINSGYAQKTTRVRGTVIDAQTKEPIPFATIAFDGKNIGTTTDYDGVFSLETQWASNKIKVLYIGYRTLVKDVNIGKNQVINFELESENIILDAIEIVAKKTRYRNKENPAVALIRKAIKNKATNRSTHLDYLEYDKYKKIEFDLNNITDKFRNRKVFNDLQFIFEHVDTSIVNGKPYLPVFLEETLSKVYYRKTPKAHKEYVSGSKMVGFSEYVDAEGVDMLVDNMYNDLDIYDNNIDFLTNQFISPLSPISPTIYKFHILDTLDYKGFSVINLAFQPRNKQDLAFIGNLYITNDDTYAVTKVEMKITDEINLNFVNDVLIQQEFDYVFNKCWKLTKDELIVDFNMLKKGLGMFGKKTIHYNNYVFNQPKSDSIYDGIENTINASGYDKLDNHYWEKNRPTDLTKQEKSIYIMVDSIQKVPAFMRAMDVMFLVVAGYWNFDNFDMGPVNAFYSFNDVEGFRLRLGGRTSRKFSDKFQVGGYLLYGFKDKRFKHSINAIMSLNDKAITDKSLNTLQVMYQVETNFPGMDLQFINEDNFLLSFKRGVADKIFYYKMFKLEHAREWGSGLSTTLRFKNVQQEPGGTLLFENENSFLNNITTSEFSSTIRYAPNEKFYQGVNYRTPIFSNYPILQLSVSQGIKGLINGDYSYTSIKFNLFKRFSLAPIGSTFFEAEAGKVFGKGLPFPLLTIHRANQTYAYQLRSYNLMNFLEFVSDQYVSVFLEHRFYGFIFNKIPLLKHLKFREIISFKGVYGAISDGNNPEKTPGIIKLPSDLNGNPSTFSFKSKPYMEVSVGVGNIFKFFRVDLVRRLTYLDNPNVSNMGIRGRFKFDF